MRHGQKIRAALGRPAGAAEADSCIFPRRWCMLRTDNAEARGVLRGLLLAKEAETMLHLKAWRAQDAAEIPASLLQSHPAATPLCAEAVRSGAAHREVRDAI